MTASLPHPTFDGYQWLKRDIIRGVSRKKNCV